MVCHSDQVTIISGAGRTVELEAGVFRLLMTSALVRSFLLSPPDGGMQP